MSRNMKPANTMGHSSAFDSMIVEGAHAAAPVYNIGTGLHDARMAAILLHGRGGSAEDILRLARVLNVPDIVFLAPDAAGRSWYPQSFLAAHGANDAHVASAHTLIEAIIQRLAGFGLGSDRVAIIGFSQGACLAADHAAKFPRRYGFIASCTGGLVGPPDTKFSFTGSLAHTPVFLGANDPDPHVPWTRVEQTAEVLEGMGASVSLVRYPGLPHAVNNDQVERIRGLLMEIDE